MKCLRLSFLLTLGLLTSSVFAETSYIPPSVTLGEEGSELIFDLEYFRPNGVVDPNSESFAFGEGTSNQTLNMRFLGKYGFTSRIEGHVGLNARHIQAEYIYQNDEFSSTRAGVESALVGFKYSFPEEDRLALALEGWYKQTLHANKIYTGGVPDQIALGDDSREIAVGGNFYFQTKSNNFFSGRIIYRDPGEDLSSEIFSEFEYALAWRPVTLLAGVENNYSLEGDAYTGDPENKPAGFRGASYMYYSVNRSWTAPYAGINFILGDLWRAEFRYTQVATGKSTDIGPRFLFRLARRKNVNKSFSKRNQQFKEYTIEGVVTKISKSRKAVVVDRGIEAGLKKGMKVDFYFFDYVGGNKLIATGVVVKSNLSKSLVKIRRRYSKKRVEEGTVARAGEISSK